VLAALLLPAVALADGQTTVSGWVMNSSNKPVAGVTVVVTNSNTGSGVTETAVTKSDGSFVVNHDETAWPNGSTCYGKVNSGGYTGSGFSQVVGLNASFAFTVVNISVVPEYGAIAGGVAIALGACAFLFIRRRHRFSAAG
jgi:hypothetical protein